MPGVANPAGLTVSYNGYTFPVSVEPPDIKIRPVPDSAGRVVIGCEYTINLTATIYPGVGELSASLQMQDLRERLNAPACELRIEGTGFSDFVVNAQGGLVWDAKYGPWPKVTSCMQLGDNQAWQIAWQCVVLVPEECPEFTRPKLGRVLEWCYRISWSIDEHGLTRRVVAGHVVIPATRLRPQDLTVPDHADRLREAVAEITIPFGFRRIPGQFDLSEDKRRLDFSVTDQQLESPFAPPPGVIIARGTHTMGTADQHNFWKYVHTISVDYTMARHADKTVAWRHFRDLYVNRIGAATHNRFGDQVQEFIPLTLQVRDALWSQGVSFTLQYLMTTTGKKGVVRFLDDIITGSGLFLPPPISDWEDWAADLNKVATRSRGYARLRFHTQDDSLLNVCVQPPGVPPPGRQLDTPYRGPGKPPGKTPPGKTDDPDAFGRPSSKGGGWVRYEVHTRIIPRDEVSRLKLLPRKPVEYSPRRIDANSIMAYEPDYKPTTDPPHVFQFRAQPSYEVEFEGTALRAGHTIDPPRLVEVGGVKAYPINDARSFFDARTVGNFLVPVVMASWRFRYALEGTPKKAIGPPDNPTLPCIEGVDDGVMGFTAQG